MKKIFVILMFITAFSVITFGQSKSDEKILMNIEQELLDSIVGKKLSAIEKYYAADYVFTTPEGVTIPRKDLFEAFKSGVLSVESSTNSEMKVYLYGNTAIITYTSMDKGKSNGTEINGKFRWTDTFVKMKGKWMIVATHGTPILST